MDLKQRRDNFKLVRTKSGVTSVIPDFFYSQFNNRHYQVCTGIKNKGLSNNQS